MQVILASASPRRLELLRQINLDVLVRPASFEEATGSGREASQVVLANALGKCRAAVDVHGDELPVIAADTVVALAENEEILGKPADKKAAKAMLMQLSGKCHRVLTGVAVRYRGQELAEVCTTKVWFRKLSEKEIDSYIATGEPLDKAGAYGIQGRGAILVEKIDGCYNNVVGLPLTCLYMMLEKLGAYGAAVSE